MRLGGAVLCGGRSSRMGADKPTLLIAGAPMAQRVAAALLAGGCTPVITVGGPTVGEIESVPDRWPGEGPLGGVVTALSHMVGPDIRRDAVMVTAADQPLLEAAVVASLVGALGDFDVAVATDSAGAPQPLCALWTVRCLPYVQAAFDAGLRAVHGALMQLDTIEVAVADESLTNVNTPADVERLRSAGLG
jgi:molybdenum cofactor guanylyltransferase